MKHVNNKQQRILLALGLLRAHFVRAMKTKHNKHRSSDAAAINISIPSSLNTELAKILAKLGFKGPSDYVQARIRLDAA